MNDYESIKTLARQYAQTALDFEAFDHQFLPEFEQKPHPALYLQLHTSDGRFPHTLTVSSFSVPSYDLSNPTLPPSPYASFYLKFPLTRPDYNQSNSELRGNHVIVELLHLIKQRIDALTPDKPVHVFTGRLKWDAFVRTEQYQSLLVERLLNAQIEHKPSAPKGRVRL